MENKELLERIENAVASLGCIVCQENVDEIREAIRVLCDCKEVVK